MVEGELLVSGLPIRNYSHLIVQANLHPPDTS